MEFHELLGRMQGLAIIDILGTFVISFLIFKFYKKQDIKTLLLIFIILFIIGEFVHLFLNIKTPFLKLFY